MKKVIIYLLFLLVVPCGVNAQSYFPLLGDSNVWYVKNIINTDDGHGGNKLEFTSIHVAYGDTTIMGKSYKTVRIQDDYTHITSGHNGIVGYLREDTTLRKVYFLGKDSASEIVIYNFSVSNNDTLFIHFEKHQNGTGGFPKTDFYRTGVKVQANEYNGRKQIRLLNSKYFIQNAGSWIEGIGSLKTPLYFYNPSESPNLPYFLVQLQCFYQDGKKIFSLTDKCYEEPISSISKEFVSESKLSVVQLSTTLHISNAMCDETHVFLYDMQGKCLSNITLKQCEGQISLAPLPAGIYSVVCVTNNQIFTKKFSKMH